MRVTVVLLFIIYLLNANGLRSQTRFPLTIRDLSTGETTGRVHNMYAELEFTWSNPKNTGEIYVTFTDISMRVTDSVDFKVVGYYGRPKTDKKEKVSIRLSDFTCEPAQCEWYQELKNMMMPDGTRIFLSFEDLKFVNKKTKKVYEASELESFLKFVVKTGK